MTNMLIENFIGVFDNVYNENFCKSIVETFEILHKEGYTYSRQRSDNCAKVVKDDNAIFTSLDRMKLNKFENDVFMEGFWEVVYKAYAEKYDILSSNTGAHQIWENKIQRTEVSQGYHAWHYESSAREVAGRLLSYIVYLNDVEEGGETEFLYIPKRVKPVMGRVLLFPAAFTHTHRGNPPISNTKYIATGWVEF